ncbi:hypothetical protein HMPREF0083_02931 [Aneurinibacillus aneurinilyticus ATCC 12856]|uniref:Uncharacterized protein n=1 Tax=Aneurinibacillus aneurinilyticus ATCC 12856 TaxID=649747 RepID=U1X1Z2_ANEAE|nr:hypothetical protein HMPREF0083_02931 [Aneurinibacillus aneurinilyticus ATCC 12856]
MYGSEVKYCRISQSKSACAISSCRIASDSRTIISFVPSYFA